MINVIKKGEWKYHENYDYLVKKLKCVFLGENFIIFLVLSQLFLFPNIFKKRFSYYRHEKSTKY